MNDKQVVCFEMPRDLQEATLRKAAAEGVGIDELINRALQAFLHDGENGALDRRRHRRTAMTLRAVARPLNENDENIILADILDVSQSGLRLLWDGQGPQDDLSGWRGRQVEIVFTLPECAYPVCFICEIRNVYRTAPPGLGCEFLRATGDSRAALKRILDQDEEFLCTA